MMLFRLLLSWANISLISWPCPLHSNPLPYSPVSGAALGSRKLSSVQMQCMGRSPGSGGHEAQLHVAPLTVGTWTNPGPGAEWRTYLLTSIWLVFLWTLNRGCYACLVPREALPKSLSWAPVMSRQRPRCQRTLRGREVGLAHYQDLQLWVKFHGTRGLTTPTKELRHLELYLFSTKDF